MKTIGITGGVGSGKSQILQILREEYQAQVILADEVAHLLMEPGQAGYQSVIQALGTSFLEPDGQIDRKKLAEVIFHDPSALETMNKIIHPMVWLYIQNEIHASTADLVVIEAALMYKEQSSMYDEIWYVYTSEENRIKRLAESRGYSREKSLSIMENQTSERFFRSLADVVIDNNGSLDDTRKQIEKHLKCKNI